MISYNTTTKVITVTSTTRLQDVYTDSENVFSGSAYMQFQPPLLANTPTLFTLINGWTFSAGSIQYLTSAALQDSAGDNVWCNVQTLGSIAAGTTLYIQQGNAVTFTAPATGHINILLAVRTNGADIAAKAFTVYARLFQKTYSSFNTTGGANVANIPLATQDDINLTIAQAALDAYTTLSITWGVISRDANDGQGAKNYNVLIKDTGNHSLAQIYNWLQRQLLKSTDIDSAAGGHLGTLTAPLVSFAGGKMFTGQGVWVEGFTATDNNNVQYTDATGAVHVPPLSIPIVVNVDSALTTSGAAQVAVFKLNTPYVAGSYTPAQIVSTLINATVPQGATSTSTSLTYTGDFPVLVVVRKPGFQPFTQGVTVGNGGLNVTAQNPVDTIFGA